MGEISYIQSFSGSTVTSPDHCLNHGDYIVITGALGSISSQVNGKIFQITMVQQTTFQLVPPIASGTYFVKIQFTNNVQVTKKLMVE